MDGRPALLAAALLACSAAAGCSSISTVRVQPDNVAVGPHLRPIAIIHAQVTSAYVLFLPIPGHVSLDQVVNRMLIATAKELGADKVVNIQVDITPEGGVWMLRELLGWRSAEATGVAVAVEPDAAQPVAPASAQAQAPAPAPAPAPAQGSAR